MTAEEAVNVSLNQYPSLYTSATLANARLKIFDQIFNVIGNGYRDHDEFVNAHQWTPKIAEMARGFPSKYIGVEPLYTGYMATTVRGEGAMTFEMADIHSSLQGLYTEAEKEFHPDVKKWSLSNGRRGQTQPEVHSPYPNFKTEYSLLYHVKIEELDDSWLKAGAEYYEYCREYFNSPESANYHGAWPADPQKQTRLIADYEQSIARCIKGIEDQAEQWAVITKAYETPYEGDTARFIQARWAKDKARIGIFIESTLSMLEEHLTNRRDSSPSP